MDASNSTPRSGESATGAECRESPEERARRIIVEGEVDRLADVLHGLRWDDQDLEELVEELDQVRAEISVLVEVGRR